MSDHERRLSLTLSAMLVVAALTGAIAFTGTVAAVSDGSIDADPADPGANATHTVSVDVTDNEAGNALADIYVNYSVDPAYNGSVENVTFDDVLRAGIDMDGDGDIDRNASDLKNVLHPHNGTVVFDFGGDTDIKQNESVVVVFNNTTNPGAAGNYTVKADINTGSKFDPVNTTLEIGENVTDEEEIEEETAYEPASDHDEIIDSAPPNPGVTATHHVAVATSSNEVGNSLSNVVVNYHADGSFDGSIQNVDQGDVKQVGFDVDGDGDIEISTMDDLKSVTATNVGETLQLDFGGNYGIKDDYTVVVVFADADNPSSTGEYDVEVDLNTQSTANPRTGTLTLANFTSYHNVSVTNVTETDVVYNNTTVENTTWENVTLVNDTFTNATLEGTVWNGTTLVNATLTNATWTNATYENVTAANVTVANATWNNTTVTDTVWNNTTVVNTTYENVTVEETTATATAWTNTTWENTSVTNATLNETTMTNATFENVTVTNSTFENVTFENVTVTNTTIANATWENTTVTNATFENGSWTNATVTNTTFAETNATDTAFVNTTIDDANVTESTFDNVTVTNTTWSESNVTAADWTNSTVAATINDSAVANVSMTGTTWNATSGFWNTSWEEGSFENTTFDGVTFHNSTGLDAAFENVSETAIEHHNITLETLTVENEVLETATLSDHKYKNEEKYVREVLDGDENNDR